MEKFQSIQVNRKFSLRFNSFSEKVFPLLCPVREKEWIPGWDFEWIFSKTGLIGECCLFKTKEYGEDTFWFVVEYDQIKFRIVFVQFVPDLLTARFTVHLVEQGGKTIAQVEYVFTSLSEKGKEYIEKELTQEKPGKEMEAMELLLTLFWDKEGKFAELIVCEGQHFYALQALLFQPGLQQQGRFPGNPLLKLSGW